MDTALSWEREGLQWPNRAHSRFVTAAGLRWHVQHWSGPAQGAPLALLLHGTGASTHSWRELAPLLARQMAVLAMDLPGHGFTGPAPGRQSQPHSLPGMARALAELLGEMEQTPALLVGHSAGAAIALRLCLDGLLQPERVIGLNAALLPLSGLAGQLFSPVAKLMSLGSVVPRLFARRASQPAVFERLLQGTGSQIDDTGRALYRLLVSDPGHVAGALAMMAHWDLPALARDLGRLGTPLDLIVGLQDATVSPGQADEVLARLPVGLGARCIRLAGLGHLAHEEAPQQLADLIASLWRGESPPASTP
jgi:magnesium chelatase accessory protein